MGMLAGHLKKLRKTNVELELPRFKVEFGVHDLKPELMSTFGIKEAFRGRGGFDGMSDNPDLHLSAVLHKAVVEVNEEGTKAAAVTAAVMNTMACEEDEPVSVVVDRPFLFLVRDVSTGLLLFSGIVKDPELDS